jgi:hypothetical protein
MIFGQEIEPEGNEQQTQTGQQPAGGQVAIGMGTLKFDGMLLAGARAEGVNQEGWAKDGNWALEGINPIWGENRADLYVDYSFNNYGAFLGLRAQYWGANNFDYGSIFARYAFVYANFGPAKVSVGKLYDELLPVQGSKVWKSSGPGTSHRFTDDESYSIRFEAKPVEGLNVGLQWFFPAFDGISEGFRLDSGRSMGLDETEAWKELGIGAQYSNSLFDAQLGVRFDSAADRYNKLDTGPTGDGTYLDHYYGQASLLAKQIPATGFLASDLMGDGIGLPKYKHLDKIVNSGVNLKPGGDPTNPADYEPYGEWLPYDDGHYAFFGCNFKGVKNLTANAHGGLYNLGAFDEFGYGRFAEFIKYDNIIGGLGIGITMQQEFYGSDVFDENKQVPDPMTGGTTMMDNPNYRVNSPFLQFGPQISYALITDPRMPLPILSATLDTSFGICPNVLDIYVKINPGMSLFLGTFMANLYYEMEFTDYVDESLIKPMTKHTIALALMVLF